MDYLNIETNPPFEASSLHKCLYCDNSLPAKNREHIFNSCWGGTHKTGQIICDNCNAFFSNFDDAFQSTVKFIMNAWQFKGERHKAVPVIETNSIVKLAAGGKPVRDSQIDVFKKENGEVSISLNASSKNEARKLIKANYDKIESLLERELTEEDIEKILSSIRTSEVQQEDVGTLKMEIKLPIQDQYRSAAHTMLKCLALFDVETALSDNLKNVRDFVRLDKGSWEDYAIKARSIVAMNNHFPELDVKYNTVEIFYSGYMGKIFGCLVILGRIKKWVILSNNYIGPDKVLFVLEKLNSGGKLERLRWTSGLDPVPIVSTTLEKPTINEIAGESQKIISESISVDAPINEFLTSIQKITDKNETIDEGVIEEISQLFINYGVSIIKANGIDSISGIDLEELLETDGFKTKSRKYLSKGIEDEGFISDGLEFLDKIIKYIVTQKV